MKKFIQFQLSELRRNKFLTFLFRGKLFLVFFLLINVISEQNLRQVFQRLPRRNSCNNVYYNSQLILGKASGFLCENNHRVMKNVSSEQIIITRNNRTARLMLVFREVFTG